MINFTGSVTNPSIRKVEPDCAYYCFYNKQHMREKVIVTAYFLNDKIRDNIQESS